MKSHASMNHIYRLVWNQVLSAWVAVAETARGRGKGSSRKLVAAALSLTSAVALAGPDGGQVVAGTGSIAQAGSTTTITQSSPNLSLNWQHFNLAPQETVNFLQPSASALAINRIFDTNGSQILGHLNANGQVWLINPNGILFGQGAQVNVGGLVASTLDLNAASLNGNARSFSGNGTGSVVNQGTINSATGGYVALLGNTVSNQGTISAQLGTVALGAGSAVTLTFNGNSLVQMQVDQSTLNNLSDNGGLIRADGGVVLMSAGAKNELLASVVNNTGVIEARTVENHEGVITLLGGMTAGTVTVGGTLDASAPNGGNGGFVETSAARVKVGDGVKVTTAAPSGKTGTWLIDPLDIAIDSSLASAIGSALGGSSDVTISTAGSNTPSTTSGESGSTGDISVNSPISWLANKLTLNASNNININANLNGSVSASLALEYGQGAPASGNTSNIITNGATVNLPAGTTNFTTKQGSDGSVKTYTVITALGAATDAAAAPVTPSLQGMAATANLTKNYALGGDIDATATSAWNLGGSVYAGFMPIGDPSTPFTGTFDGLGHSICNLTVNLPSTTHYVGLFGYADTGSAIRNVGLIGGSVTGNSTPAGGLAGYNAGTVSNSYATVAVSGTVWDVGGLVGSNHGEIKNSYATGTVNGVDFVGGLVGYNGSKISNSYATGTVNGADYVGGLVGKSDNGTISNSYATGNATSGSFSSGGLVGLNSNGSSVTDSYATGSVSAGNWGGGLVGSNDTSKVSNSYATGNVSGGGSCYGGLVGVNINGTINYSYATGNVSMVVSGGDFFGGLVGGDFGTTGSISFTYATGLVTTIGALNVGGLMGSNAGTVSNSFWNNDVNGSPGIGSGTTTGATGLTTAQMHTATSFAGGLNFTATAGATGNNWVIVNADGTLQTNASATAGATYPMLASEYATTINGAHQLQLMQMVPTASYTLGRNISALTTGNSTDVWGSSGFVPIGNYSTPFNGTFDGLGHTISDLTLNWPTTNTVGLIRVTTNASAMIRNVGILGGSVTGLTVVGGLVADLIGGTITNSYTTASVTATAGGGLSVYAGGLVGALETGTLSNSYATGNVSAVTGSLYVGGLVGANFDNISNSYATGTVNGTTNVGGLVGASWGNISNSYAIGTVNGTTNVGELVGFNYSSITSSHWNSDIKATGIGAGTLTGATGLTTAQMQLQSNFSSLDFANTWVMYDTHTNPLLRVFMTPLTVTSSSAAKTYDGLAYSGGTASYSCCKPADVLGTVSFSNSPSEGATNAGSYAITPGGLYSNQQGYIISYASGTLTVDKAPLTISTADVTKTYDGTLGMTGNATGQGAVTSDTLYINANTGFQDFLSGGTFAFTNANARTGTKTVTTRGVTVGDGVNNGNYSVTYAKNTTSTINKAPLTISTTDVTKTYDGTLGMTGDATGQGAVTSDPLYFNETSGIQDFLSGGTFAFTDKNVGSGNKTVTTSGVTVTDGSGNYNVSYASNTHSTINPADLTLSGTRVYNGTTVFDGSNLTATGVNGETFAMDGAGASGNLSTKNVQTNQALANLTGLTLGTGNTGAAVATNYNSLATSNSSVSVTPKTITATGLTANDKVYNANDVAILNTGSATLTGGATTDVDNKFYTSDLLTLNATNTTGVFTTSVFTLGKDVGTAKAVTVSGLTLGNDGAGNYTLIQQTGLTADITAKALTASGLTGISKVYNTTLVDALSGAAVLANGATLDGDGKYYSSDTVALTGTAAGAFSDKNVGTAKTVVISGLGVDNTNYTVSHANTAADISPATLPVTGLTAANKIYNTTTAATLIGTAVVAPLGSDLVYVGGTGSGVFVDPNVGTGKAVIVNGYSLNGTDAGNYAVVQPTGLTANITAVPVVIVDPPANPPAPQQDPVISVLTQLASNVFSPRAETRPDALHLLPTITVIQSSSPAPVAADSTSAPERSSNTVVNTMMTIGGGMGPSLQIVSGGMTLPTNMVNVNE